RPRGRPVHPLQGDDRCPERDQPSSERGESGFELVVIGLKSCRVMNLDEGDEIGRHCDCGFEWGDPIGHGCDPGVELSPAAPGTSALKRRYRTDAMLLHLCHVCVPRGARKTQGPASYGTEMNSAHPAILCIVGAEEALRTGIDRDVPQMHIEDHDPL